MNNNYNKNISAAIILVSILCIIVSFFLIPKKDKYTNLHEGKNIQPSYLHLPILQSQRSFKGEHIVVIRVEGIISDSEKSFFKDPTSSSAALEYIHKATKDPSVKGILLRINSPGGTVAASQELYKAILNAKRKKPVVVTMGDIAASGGYYIASASDVIFANPGTLTGSIGVITSYFNLYNLFTKIGVEGVTIKSGKYKDIGSPTRPITEEERKIMQNLLNDSYNQFIKDVAKGRQITIKKVKELANGLIYTGNQAKKAGLVDYIGDYYKALRHTQKLVKERFPELSYKYKNRDIPVEESWEGSSLFDMLLGVYNENLQNKSVSNKLFKSYSYSKFQPLWLLE